MEVVAVCGRYAATKDPAALAAEFDALDATEDKKLRADYNVAPTKNVVTVVQRHPRHDGEPDQDTTVRSLRLMRWGLVPAWAKDPSAGARMINARAETAATKPAFRSSLAKRRCLMPADGWYEWRRDGSAKQPFFMTPGDGSSLAMAALWTAWHDKADPSAEPLVTCAVLTTEAVGPAAEIHDRMPVLMPPERWATWLDPDVGDVAKLLTDPPLRLIESLEYRPISSAVNNVRNNGPELLDRHEPSAELELFDQDEAKR